jgi:Ca2+-transporting ATPase
MKAHSRTRAAVLSELETDRAGLDTAEARRRLETYGENRIEEADAPSAFGILVDQFRDYLVYILLVAVVLSVGVGVFPGESPQYGEATIILFILLGNGLFGFYQDYRAERSIAALAELSTPTAVVSRDGQRTEVGAETLVPGDVVFLNQGDAVPADARLLEAESLSTTEAPLTGESLQVRKDTAPVDEDAPVAERTSMVYQGTDVVRGSGVAAVTRTGMDTEIGAIADEINSTVDEKTPFQREVDEMGRTLGLVIPLFVVVIALIQWFVTGTDWITLVLLGVGLVVAAIPEALPAIVTFSLALGSRRMLEQNALVRRLPVVESLGSVNYIVTDKTGTLTEGTMTVRKVYCDGAVVSVTGVGTDTGGSFEADGDADVDAEAVEAVLRCGVYCNNAGRTVEGFTGDPTEIALLVAGEKAGVEDAPERQRVIPFSSDRKRMTTVAADSTAYTKGAPEVVLDRCDRILVDGEAVPLTAERRREVEAQVSAFAGDALRVLGFARKTVDDVDADEDVVESGLVFLGLQAMRDPPREGVAEAVADCRTAGIRVVMATGDDVDTARAIGEQLGFDPDGVLTGREVETLSDEELATAVRETEIFARVSPHHKVRILDALKRGEFHVAMTGDGVNDAPALKKADVGVAMGCQGTDVAKKSSDIVLQDDDFATIRDAIREGRTIFDNVRKVTNYLLSTNSAEVMFVFLGTLVGAFFFPDALRGGDAVVLTAVMILWVNFSTDGPPAIALAADEAVPGVMERPPRAPDESIIDGSILAMIGLTGPLAAAVFLPLFFLNVQDLTLAQSVLFTALAMFEIVMFQVVRREYRLGTFSNGWLLVAVALAFVGHLAVLYTPLAGLFEVVPLTVDHWTLVGAALVVFTALIVGVQWLLLRRFGARSGASGTGESAGFDRETAPSSGDD